MLIHLMFRLVCDVICHLVCNVFEFAFQGQGKYTNNGTLAEVEGRTRAPLEGGQRNSMNDNRKQRAQIAWFGLLCFVVLVW